MPSLRIEVSGQVVVARLTDAVVRVGRDVDCDLRIDDKTVSATHLQIEPLPGGGHKLTDLNSGLPTRVNGLVVKRVSLKPGDVIDVGPARIVYDPENAPFVTGNPAVAAPAPAPRPVAAPPRALAPSVEGVAARPVPFAGDAPRSAPAAAVPPAAAAADETTGPSSPTTAGPVVVPTTSRARSSSSKLKSALVLTGAFAVVALVVAAIIRSDSGHGAASLQAMGRDLEGAKALATKDLDRALAEFDRLSKAPSEGVRNEAAREAEYWRGRIRDADRDVSDLERQVGKMDAEAVASELAILQQKYGASVMARHAGLVERLEAARKEAAAARVKAAVESSRSLAGAGKLHDALDLWNQLLAETPGDDAARRVAEEERQQIEAKAVESFKALAAEVDALATKDGPAAAATRLRARHPDFLGTSAATAIELRARAFDAKAVAAAAAAALEQRLAHAAAAKGAAPAAGSPSGAG